MSGRLVHPKCVGPVRFGAGGLESDSVVPHRPDRQPSAGRDELRHSDHRQVLEQPLVDLITQLGRLDAEVGIAALSLAMGLMNTTLSHVGAEPVSLTFVTGTLNKLGHHLALSVCRAPLADAQGPWDTHLRRAGALASVWAGFLTGAVLSAAAIRYFGAWVLLAPLLILLALALFSSPDWYRATDSL
jgi:hypothetical protein